MNFPMEIRTWSTPILTTLMEEEDCSLEVRNACQIELDSRRDGGQPKVTLTHEMLQNASTDAGGWTRAQIQALGIKWPPRHGWLQGLVGQQVTAAQWKEFVDAREIRRKGKRRN